MPLARFVTGVYFIVVMAGAGVVCGQDYPAKPIRIIAAAAGGGGDTDARE